MGISHDQFIDRIADRVRQARQGQQSHELNSWEPPGTLPDGVVDETEFWACVTREVKRSERYDRPFTVLLIRPQGTDGLPAKVWSELIDLVASNLVRACDIVGLGRREPTLALLLPETTVQGASAVVQRIRSAISEPETCKFTVIEYPENGEQLEQVRAKAA